MIIIGVFFALNESDVYSEDVLEKASELYKSKQPKIASFVIIHCCSKVYVDGQKQERKVENLCL